MSFSTYVQANPIINYVKDHSSLIQYALEFIGNAISAFGLDMFVRKDGEDYALLDEIESHYENTRNTLLSEILRNIFAWGFFALAIDKEKKIVRILNFHYEYKVIFHRLEDMYEIVYSDVYTERHLEGYETKLFVFSRPDFSGQLTSSMSLVLEQLMLFNTYVETEIIVTRKSAFPGIALTEASSKDVHASDYVYSSNLDFDFPRNDLRAQNRSAHNESALKEATKLDFDSDIRRAKPHFSVSAYGPLVHSLQDPTTLSNAWPAHVLPVGKQLVALPAPSRDPHAREKYTMIIKQICQAFGVPPLLDATSNIYASKRPDINTFDQISRDKIQKMQRYIIECFTHIYDLLFPLVDGFEYHINSTPYDPIVERARSSKDIETYLMLLDRKMIKKDDAAERIYALLGLELEPKKTAKMSNMEETLKRKRNGGADSKKARTQGLGAVHDQ